MAESGKPDWMDEDEYQKIITGKWACYCGATEDLTLLLADEDPELTPRDEGEMVPVVLALCPTHYKENCGT